MSYTYSTSDVLRTLGPAPAGENTKSKQLEYDGMGRLVSVCELSNATGSGTCGQRTTKTGFWTKYAYDTLGNVKTVSQNAQLTSIQSRSFAFDALGRLTSETNPEAGTNPHNSYI